MLSAYTALLIALAIVSSVPRARAVGSWVVALTFLAYLFYKIVVEQATVLLIPAIIGTITLSMMYDARIRSTLLKGAELSALTSSLVALAIVYESPPSAMVMIVAALVIITASIIALVSSSNTRDSAASGIKYAAFSGLGKVLIIGGLALSSIGLWVGPLLLTIGVIVELGAFPFHAWVPDVFARGYPIGAASLSLFAELAVVVLLSKFFLTMPAAQWSLALAVLGVISMLLGAATAAVATTVGRILAYSTIAHSGIIISAIYISAQSVDKVGPLTAALILVLADGIAKAGLFTLLTEGGHSEVPSAVLGGVRTYLGIAAGIAILSLLGLPPLLGFWPKFVIFFFAVGLGTAIGWAIAVSIVMSSGLLAVAYLRLIRVYATYRSNANTTIMISAFALVALGVLCQWVLVEVFASMLAG